MKEQAKAWFPVSDIDSAFGSISFSYNGGQSLLVTLHGERTLTINYSAVIAVRFELECPGFDPIPRPMPTLNSQDTFPLLVIENSKWREQYSSIYGVNISHFVLISSDDLVQVIAGPNIFTKWIT